MNCTRSWVFLAFLLIALPISVNCIGIRDQNFGTDGLVITDLGSDSSVKSLHQQSDGKIIVVAKNNGLIVLLRYNTDGIADTTFGTAGKIVTAFGSNDSKVSFTIQSNGLFAVGNNSGVTRYNSNGTINETASFPTGDFAAFSSDGKIATATLISANGTCFGQSLKISYNLYNPDGSANTATQFCSGGSGSTGIVSLWGIVPSTTNSFYVGYTHQAFYSSGGRVREILGNSTLQDVGVDLGLLGYSLVDLASTRSHGFVSLGYFFISRQLPTYQFYMSSLYPPQTAEYLRIHGDGITAALKGNSSILVLNENFSYLGRENIEPIFGSAAEQSSVFVQSDNKIFIGGQIPSGTGYENIALVRYLSVFGTSARTSDFDRDAKSDLAVWRPSTGTWYIQNSFDGSFHARQFGLSDDKPTPADFDGDGKTDIAVWRPSNGYWYCVNSSDNTFWARNFGITGDIPVPSYYDDDERADLAVYRPSTGTWRILGTKTGSTNEIQFGIDGDIPTIGDFDGNGTSDIAVWRPSSGIWYRLNNSGGLEARQFGVNGDMPTAADYDGDGKTDISVFRPATGFWYRINSRDDSFGAVSFGLSEDKPVPGDYDGDGKADIAVFRPSSGIWYLQGSTAGFRAQQFGIGEDIPVPNALLH